mmetsp:Transcript_12827/g.31986  ORF Transcript_12827/g.31986 Transcript_12827/m.31986 type:complete len:250 (-) Transcript_12827:32-781(-)
MQPDPQPALGLRLIDPRPLLLRRRRVRHRRRLRPRRLRLQGVAGPLEQHRLVLVPRRLHDLVPHARQSGHGVAAAFSTTSTTTSTTSIKERAHISTGCNRLPGGSPTLALAFGKLGHIRELQLLPELPGGVLGHLDHHSPTIPHGLDASLHRSAVRDGHEGQGVGLPIPLLRLPAEHHQLLRHIHQLRLGARPLPGEVPDVAPVRVSVGLVHDLQNHRLGVVIQGDLVHHGGHGGQAISPGRIQGKQPG